jgi:putative oxidoreductase
MAAIRNGREDAGLLIGRLLIAALFLPSGIGKAMHWQHTVELMHIVHAPLPVLAAAIAVLCEIGVMLLIVIGLKTRWACLVMMVYTAGASYLGHPFWHMTGSAVMENQINFFKNIAIIGGFLILASAGPGRYSVDRG